MCFIYVFIIISTGAKRTSNKGPWDLVLVIYNFPNATSALKFEWAAQNPKKTTRLKHIKEEDREKQKKENLFEYNIRIISYLLNSGPWQRFALGDY